mgnify:CR=1 FL=1
MNYEEKIKGKIIRKGERARVQMSNTFPGSLGAVKIFNKPNPPICSQFVRDLHQDLDEGIEELSIWEQQEAHCGLLYEQKLIGSPDFFLEYTDLNCQS